MRTNLREEDDLKNARLAKSHPDAYEVKIKAQKEPLFSLVQVKKLIDLFKKLLTVK